MDRSDLSLCVSVMDVDLSKCTRLPHRLLKTENTIPEKDKASCVFFLKMEFYSCFNNNVTQMGTIHNYHKSVC